MTKHPLDKSERRKIDARKKRREALIKEALKRQEAEDEANRERDLAQFGSALGGDVSPQFEVHP